MTASAIKTLDDLTSAASPQTTTTGDLLHLSFIFRKPEALGIEFKCVTCADTGVLLFVEFHNRRKGMLESEFEKEFGETTACMLRLVQGTKNSGQRLRHAEIVKEIYLGDWWFSGFKTAQLVDEYEGVKWIGPSKTNKTGFPISILEITMREWTGD